MKRSNVPYKKILVGPVSKLSCTTVLELYKILFWQKNCIEVSSNINQPLSVLLSLLCFWTNKVSCFKVFLVSLTA